MTIAFIRAIITYFIILMAVRVMGKRQIGELKPHELVMTMLISQIATIPMEDNSLPFINSLVPIFTLIACEILISVINMKSLFFRNLLQGKPVIVINKGVIDQRQLKRLRFTVDDLIDSLRQKDVFDINQVEYAIIEANGTISVLQKSVEQPLTPKDLNIDKKNEELQSLVVIDGKIVKEYFSTNKTDIPFVLNELKKRNINIHDILLMSADKENNIEIIKKDK